MGKFDDPISTQPAQIAAQLITQGLPQAIAQQIGVTGAPPINHAFPIQTGYAVAPLASGNANYLQPVGAGLNTTAAQSIHVRIKHGGTHVPANQATDYVALIAYWDLDWSTGLFAQTDSFTLYAAGDTWTDVQIPAHGDTVSLALTNETGAVWSGVVDVVGTTRSINSSVVSTSYYPAGWIPGTLADQSRRSIGSAAPVAIPGGVGPVIAIPVRAGVLQVTLQPNAPVTSQGRYALTDENGIQFVTQLMITGTIGAASITQLSAQVGYHPVYLRQLVPVAGPTGLSIFAGWDR